MRRLTERYSVGDRIGRGGVGVVFRGWQTALDRPVAIKILRPELTRHSAVVARFEREALTTCRLHHPNVVTVFDVGIAEDGTRFLVMELLEGETLAARLKAVGRLPLEAVMHIGWQIIRGMGAGQGVGLVHRDLKPDNIFLLAENHVKVLDFGLATLLDRAMPPAEGAPEMRPPLSEVGGALSEGVSDSDDTVFDPLDSISPTEEISEGARARLTRPGTPVGTPRYMSPEQVLGWSVDHRSDLYSFGCILYEMLAGRSAYDGPNSRAYMHQHLHVPPRPLEDVAEGVPAPLVKIVHQLLAKSPSERYPDWSAVAEVLRQVRPQRRRTRITDREITQDLILPEAPYRFLDSFTKASRGIFFGRDQDAERFIRTWLHPDQPPIVILTGASGVGKTSFLCARVMPGLEDIDTRVIRIIGGDDPIRQLRAAIARELAQRSELNSLPELSEMTPMQALDTLVAHEGRPVAIILDQLEEIFTTGGRAEAAELQATLAAMIAGGTGGARFILSLREDYLGTLLRTLHPLPIDVVTRTIPLRPLEADDLKAALEGPSKRGLPVAYRPFLFEEGLVEEIISDLLADPAGEVAPRVQAVGARLWEMVRESPEPIITRAHYRERLGGAHGILARVLDEAIADLPLGDQGVTKELLRALTHLPGSPTSRPAPESELTAHADWERRQQILRRLEDRWRVVQGFTDPRWPEERTYRITHEALVARIQQYGEDGTGRNRARQLFHQGLSLWLQGGRQDSDLLPERHFDEVQRHIEELVLRTQSERAFYEACLTIHNEGWMRRHLEARRARSRSRMLFTLLPGLFILLGVTLGQAPVGFITLQTLRVRLAIALSLPAPDLSDAPLRGANLAGNALVGADLQRSDLREANLAGADLTKADLRNSRLDEADLSGANLQGALLDGASLRATRFDLADLRQASFEETSNRKEASFLGALYDLDTRWAPDGEVPEPPYGALGPWGQAQQLVVRDTPLSQLDLHYLAASGADFSGARLIRTDLNEAVLDGAKFSGASLRQAKLRRASLRGADLSAADLSQAELSGADLSGANLSEARLVDADLTGVKLDRAELCGADLSQARMSRVSLDGATACTETQWPWGYNVPDGVTLAER